MGVHRGRRGARLRGSFALTHGAVAAARVVPVIGTFSVDQGFWYEIPPALEDRIEIGSLVRIPLGGRRVRGIVVETGERPAEGLKEVAQVSGRAPIAGPPLLEVLAWAANHYVAPLGPMLDRAAPPNVPPGPPKGSGAASGARIDHRLSDLVDAAAAGRRHPPVALLDPPPAGLSELAEDCRAAGVSLLVVAPTADEVRDLAAAIGGAPLTVTPDTLQRDATTAWRNLRYAPSVVVGTPRVAPWPVRHPAIICVVEESRRAMKERQSPTVAVRELVLARCRREGLIGLFAGPTPSAELVGSGAEIRRVGTGRLWPLVEVVDRRSDDAGFGLLGGATRDAIRAVARSGSVFVYAHRRGFAAASRCVACRTLRVCTACGSRPGPGTSCERCGQILDGCSECGGERFEPLGAGVGRLVEEVGRIVGPEAVGPTGSGTRVQVGTERDLTRLAACDLVVLVDADGLIRGANYRAAEEALRIGARLAGGVRRGGRLIVQTSDPDHHAVVALQRADPLAFHEVEIRTRERFGYPPAGELLVVEARDLDDVDTAASELVAIAGRASVLGPAPSRSGTRWLVQSSDLTPFKRDLRPVLTRWRGSGATVRVDADPIEL